MVTTAVVRDGPEKALNLGLVEVVEKGMAGVRETLSVGFSM